ncbi:hypothetical protein B0O40_0403 [Ruminococcaceae bacterium R-25]|nr:hypothetical protein B0O40_0403 [Ruminococcaceae bacterium R-25]SUQ11040.1 hypothetical protein SAMN06297423_0403 [Oscillospiraceae bacterium]
MNFIYPQNMKAKANMWLWSLKDFAIIGIGALLSAVFLIYLHKLLLVGIVAVYAFMTIRLDETTVMDYIRYAFRYFITTQQYFEWR